MLGRCQEQKLGLSSEENDFQCSVPEDSPLSPAPHTVGPGQGCILWATTATHESVCEAEVATPTSEGTDAMRLQGTVGHPFPRELPLSSGPLKSCGGGR